MMTNTRPAKTYVADEEIDLGKLLIQVRNIISRSIKILLIALTLGLGLGLFQYYTTKPIYQSSMIASSRILTMYRVISLTEVLNKLAAERNDTTLARLMRINPSVAGKIVQIEARSIKALGNSGSIDAKTASLDDNVFEIIIQTYDNTLVNQLQAGLLHYLQHNDFVEKRIAIQKKNLETMQDRVKEEIKKLDSLRFSVNHMISKGLGSNSTILMNDPASINKEIMALYERELNTKTELLLIDDIQVIQGFVPFLKPVAPKMIKSVSLYVGFAFILATVLIILQEIRRGMKELSGNPESTKVKSDFA